MARIATVLALGLAAGVVAGCTTPAMKQTIVYGESFATTAEAVQEARNAMANAAGLGCRAIGIGGGGAGAGVETGGGLLINVLVLIECPASAPDILAATGAPVP
jgi:hypothetical protein